VRSSPRKVEGRRWERRVKRRAALFGGPIDAWFPSPSFLPPSLPPSLFSSRYRKTVADLTAQTHCLEVLQEAHATLQEQFKMTKTKAAAEGMTCRDLGRGTMCSP
jgi:hypothetical protein